MSRTLVPKSIQGYRLSITPAPVSLVERRAIVSQLRRHNGHILTSFIRYPNLPPSAADNGSATFYTVFDSRHAHKPWRDSATITIGPEPPETAVDEKDGWAPYRNSAPNPNELPGMPRRRPLTKLKRQTFHCAFVPIDAEKSRVVEEALDNTNDVKIGQFQVQKRGWYSECLEDLGLIPAMAKGLADPVTQDDGELPQEIGFNDGRHPRFEGTALGYFKDLKTLKDMRRYEAKKATRRPKLTRLDSLIHAFDQSEQSTTNSNRPKQASLDPVWPRHSSMKVEENDIAILAEEQETPLATRFRADTVDEANTRRAERVAELDHKIFTSFMKMVEKATDASSSSNTGSQFDNSSTPRQRRGESALRWKPRREKRHRDPRLDANLHDSSVEDDAEPITTSAQPADYGKTEPGTWKPFNQ